MAISACNDLNGNPVDWWFMYKLPRHARPPKGSSTKGPKSSGHEYLYFDAESTSAPALSPHQLLQWRGAVYHTLKGLIAAKSTPNNSLGWICYNDEIPNTEKNDERKGHTKGVLAFDADSNSAFWLLHSWPKFPTLDRSFVPAFNYGQTYLCVTLKDVDTANLIAEQMGHQQEPQVYDFYIPDALKGTTVDRLTQHVDVDETNPPCNVAFHSKAGQAFRLLAKNRHWDRDFWIDWVGPQLGADFKVETWRRGTVPGTEDSGKKYGVEDALYINLTPLGVEYEWHYTKDHAKWAASDTDHWVCVADINRQTSQERRGGGAICFQHELLWKSLEGIEQLKR